MPFAPINGQELFYQDSGGDKPTILMMHGFLFDQSMFDAQVAALESDYRCIRFDARAFGQTKWDGQPFSLWDTAADAIGLLDHLGLQQAVFVGMSQGGYALVRLAVRYPDRVKALVFLSTYNGVDSEDTKSIYRSMRDTWVNQGPDVLLPTYRDLFLGTDDHAQRLYADKWEAVWRAVGPQAYTAASNNLTERDAIDPEQVKTLTMPALVIHGTADVGMPIALAEALFASLPNAKRMVCVEGAAHGANVTHPEPINAAIREFLAEAL